MKEFRFSKSKPQSTKGKIFNLTILAELLAKIPLSSESQTVHKTNLNYFHNVLLTHLAFHPN